MPTSASPTSSPSSRRRDIGLEAICHDLTKLMRGETKRLIITIPPRHLRSICTSAALPAFVLGHDPTRRIICVNYSQDLAVKHNVSASYLRYLQSPRSFRG